MNIALLHRHYPPYGLTFSTTHFYAALARALVARGHQIHVVAQAVRGEEDRTDDDGVHVHRVSAWPGHRDIAFLSHFVYLASAWRKLRALEKQHSIELVDAYVFSAHGFFPSLWKQVPLVLQVHAWSDMFLESKNYSGLLSLLGLRATAYMENISLKRADKIIVTSPQTYRYFTEKKRLAKERVAVVWDSRIDLEKFRFVPSDIRDHLGIPEDATLVLYVGTVDARKGIQVLAEALPPIVARFPSALFVLLGRDTLTAPGGGSLKHYLLNHARECGVAKNVRLIEDFFPEDDLARLYSACDVYVLPSLLEGSGMTVAEAMACNRPVVATATGIASDLKSISPLLVVVPPGDPKALAQGITKVLSIPREERERLAASHRHIVEERFSFERMVEQILAVYEEAIAEAEAAKPCPS